MEIMRHELDSDMKISDRTQALISVVSNDDSVSTSLRNDFRLLVDGSTTTLKRILENIKHVEDQLNVLRSNEKSNIKKQAILLKRYAIYWYDYQLAIKNFN